MTNAELFVRAARLLLPVREAGFNRGRFVEAIIRSAGGKAGEPWCASFVWYVGRGMFGKEWKWPQTRSCDILLEAFRKTKKLSPVPVPGGLFFIMRSANDAFHVGIVDEDLTGGRFTTVEGNSNDKGHHDGDGVVSNVRGGTGLTNYIFTQAVI